MSTYRRKAQPTIEAIRLPRPMQVLDGYHKGKPVLITAEAGDYLIVEGEHYYILTPEEFAAQFEEDEHAVVHHRKPQHVQGETTVTPWMQVFPQPPATVATPFTWRSEITNKTFYIDPPEAGKAV